MKGRKHTCTSRDKSVDERRQPLTTKEGRKLSSCVISFLKNIDYLVVQMVIISDGQSEGLGFDSQKNVIELF